MNRREIFKAALGAVGVPLLGAGGVVITAAHPDLTPFALFVAQIQSLAWRDGACPQGELYCAPEAWRDAFDDGLTPKKAWQEERWAAAEMLG